MTTEAAVTYPLRFDVEYPEKLSRLLIFVKWLLAIPHFIILYVLGIIVSLVTLIAFFAILFTKRYPQGMFNFAVGINRWGANVSAYVGLLRDEYPPFSSEPGNYPVTFDIEYPEHLSRWMPLVKWLLAIPHIIVLLFLYLAIYVVYLVAWFAILFTGKFPAEPLRLRCRRLPLELSRLGIHQSLPRRVPTVLVEVALYSTSKKPAMPSAKAVVLYTAWRPMAAM